MTTRPTGEIPVHPVSEFRFVVRQDGERRYKALQQKWTSLGGVLVNGGVEPWRTIWKDVPIVEVDESDA